MRQQIQGEMSLYFTITLFAVGYPAAVHIQSTNSSGITLIIVIVVRASR